MLGQIPYATNKTDTLVRANLLFQNDYSYTGMELLPGIIIVMEGDYLVLLNRSTATDNYVRSPNYTTPVVTALYHDLKMVSHLTLSTFVLLWPFANNNIQVFPNLTATQFLSATSNAIDSINKTRFSDAVQLERNQQIAKETIIFLKRVIFQQTVSVSELQNFTASLVDRINMNVQEAAISQIDLMLAVLADWRTRLQVTLFSSYALLSTLSRFSQALMSCSSTCSRSVHGMGYASSLLLRTWLPRTACPHKSLRAF